MKQLIEELRRFRDERDWGQFHTPKDLAISVSVEAAELLELFQWQKEADQLDPEVRDKASGEAADVLMYLLLLCDRLEIDLVTAARDKLDRNRRRFPVAGSRGVAKPVDQEAN